MADVSDSVVGKHQVRLRLVSEKCLLSNCMIMGRREQKERETHVAGEELDGHAQDEQEPEDVQALQHQQEAIKEVIPKEGRIDGDWIDPGTVHDPETEKELGDTAYNMNE